jgi:hypothetical protein
MAIVRTVHFYEALFRLAPAGEDTAEVLGVQVSSLERFTEDDVVLFERVLPAAPADFAGVAAVLADDDLAALKAAVDNEVAGRA